MANSGARRRPVLPSPPRPAKTGARRKRPSGSPQILASLLEPSARRCPHNRSAAGAFSGRASRWACSIYPPLRRAAGLRRAPTASSFWKRGREPCACLPEPAAATDIWGYNGGVPGPLLRYKKGRGIKVRLVNRLAQPTSLTWPGVRIANAMDGAGGLTQEPVAPGASFDYRFTPQDSGLFSYRPGVSPFVAEQLGRGLYGALIVDETDPPPADRDMLAIIADWRLDEKGAIVADFNAEADAAAPDGSARSSR